MIIAIPYWWKNNIYEYADKDDIIRVSAKENNPSASSNSSIRTKRKYNLV